MYFYLKSIYMWLAKSELERTKKKKHFLAHLSISVYRSDKLHHVVTIYHPSFVCIICIVVNRYGRLSSERRTNKTKNRFILSLTLVTMASILLCITKWLFSSCVCLCATTKRHFHMNKVTSIQHRSMYYRLLNTMIQFTFGDDVEQNIK